MKKIICRIVVVVMFVTILAKYNNISKTEAYQQINNNLVACCDQYNNRVVVYNISNNMSQEYVYNIPGAPKEYAKAYSPTDAKLRMDSTGKKILLITTGTKIFIIDYNSKKKLNSYDYQKDFNNANINVHSVDMSRKGYLYIAEPNTGTVMRYKVTDKYAVTKPTNKLSLPDAHSVLYDFENSCLWAAGDRKVGKITKTGKSVKVVDFRDSKIANERGYFRGGHCLSQNPKNSNELFLSGYNATITINKKTYSEEKGTVGCDMAFGLYSIKGIVKYNNNFYYVRNEDEGSGGKQNYHSWTTRYIRYYDNGVKNHILLKDEGRVYKIIPFTWEY